MGPIDNVLKALSDKTRLRMINILYAKDELCVCDFIEVLGITQTKASRHLTYLKHAGIVKDRREAQWVFYALQKNLGLNFMDSLVSNNLRKEKQYTEDLDKLNQWLNSELRNSYKKIQ